MLRLKFQSTWAPNTSLLVDWVKGRNEKSVWVNTWKIVEVSLAHIINNITVPCMLRHSVLSRVYKPTGWFHTNHLNRTRFTDCTTKLELWKHYITDSLSKRSDSNREIYRILLEEPSPNWIFMTSDQVMFIIMQKLSIGGTSAYESVDQIFQ